jgi:ribosome biogenesis protein BMS1
LIHFLSISHAQVVTFLMSSVSLPVCVCLTRHVQSLIKKYTRHSMGDIHGPVTVVSGKKRRLTFFECPNDLNSMIDLAKIADLVLLMVDAAFGFEMETFEFLNVLQVHGFPKVRVSIRTSHCVCVCVCVCLTPLRVQVMGVLTHLDKFRDNKTLRKTKKRFKSRFWTEIYDGAKVFFLSGE